MSGAAATIASSLTLDDGTVGGNFHGLVGLGAHLLHDVTGRRLAVLQVALGLLLNVVNKVVNHGHGDADREDSHQREGDSRICDELVGAFPVVLHGSS
jgi:hypothetical protein